MDLPGHPFDERYPPTEDESMTSKRSERVFISYSHDSPSHAGRVLELAKRLRQEGVDAWIDRYEPHPAQGWPRWMQEQIENAAFVLAVCSPTYCRRFEGKEKPGKGPGATWEGQFFRLPGAAWRNFVADAY